MRPEQVRLRILADHARLRVLFTELDDVARQVLLGVAGRAFRLRVLAEALREQFLEHLALEDRVLHPVLREIDPWGPERARQLDEEHRSQRERMRRLLAELTDARRAPEELARDVRGLVSDLLLDMLHEERTLLTEELLSEDVVETDVETD
jgi:iron-sulfur cluster repair protein YtfE (RIC family)